MATIIKLWYTEWRDKSGTRVKPGTPGAKKVRFRSAKWYGCWKEGEKQVRVPLATDKAASQAMLADLLRTKDRTAARLIDPFQPHLDRAALEHMEEYLTSIRQSGKVKDGKYFVEKRRILNTILARAGVKALRDLTGEAVNNYMNGLTTSAATRKVHLTAVNAFADWLVGMKRLAVNPLLGIARPQGGKVVRKRRALKSEELQRLLDAARERPLAEAERNTGGRYNKGGKKQWKVELRAESRERFIRLGRERGGTPSMTRTTRAACRRRTTRSGRPPPSRSARTGRCRLSGSSPSSRTSRPSDTSHLAGTQPSRGRFRPPRTLLAPAVTETPNGA